MMPDYAMTMNMNQQMMMPMQMPGQQQNPGKVFLTQRENLEGVKHKFKLSQYHEKAAELLKERLRQK